MGSVIEINDTLQLTKEQGFPAELQLEKHLVTPYTIDDIKDFIFKFKNKSGIRVYQSPPVRNFLAENRNGKWIYWGLVHIIEVTHDYVNKTTGGMFKIIALYSPDEMKQGHALIDRRESVRYFK